jgi:hypothetical protein
MHCLAGRHYLAEVEQQIATKTAVALRQTRLREPTAPPAPGLKFGTESDPMPRSESTRSDHYL